MRLLCLMLFCANNAFAKSISLPEALKNKSIEVHISGNATSNNPIRSSHRGKCLKITIVNKQALAQDVNIENAMHFVNQHESKQDLISTENLLVHVLPNQSKTVSINALCSEQHQGSPAETDTFMFSYKHDGAIEGLTKLLEKYKSFDNTAQQAMWCFTDNNSIESIYDTDMDTLIENELVKYVATQKKVPIPKRKVSTAKKRIIRYPVELFGSRSERIETPTTIGFYLTDTLNNVLETIIADDYESRNGNAKYSWKYRGQLAKGTYYFQMKKNGVWLKLQAVKLPEE